MHPAVALVLAYLSGSVPSAYLAGRLLKGVDLRTVGSGNLGATNVLRNLGTPAAVVVLALDALKGALPVLLLPPRITIVTGGDAGRILLWWAGACGAAAVLGHARSVFLLWRGGGKGVATGAGVFAALAPIPTLVAFIGFAAAVGFTRIVSLGSVTAAVVLPLTVLILSGFDSPVLIVSGAVSAFVIWSHRANIARIMSGTEPRIGATSMEEAS
jgi:glycerol-3-phosphate acyltransferase PlsY